MSSGHAWNNTSCRIVFWFDLARQLGAFGFHKIRQESSHLVRLQIMCLCPASQWVDQIASCEDPHGLFVWETTHRCTLCVPHKMAAPKESNVAASIAPVNQNWSFSSFKEEQRMARNGTREKVFALLATGFGKKKKLDW